MSDSNIVSLINNLIMQRLDARGYPVDQKSSNDMGDTPNATDEPEINSVGEEIGLNLTELNIQPYEWSPPHLPVIQIQPFSPKQISTPSNLKLKEQTIQLSADGTTTVTVIIECDDITGAAEYEFRVSGN